MLGERFLTGRSSLFLRGEIWTVLTTPLQLSASHFQKISGIGQEWGRFLVNRRAPSMLLYGTLSSVRTKFPVATPVAVLWPTCKPYEGKLITRADARICACALDSTEAWSALHEGCGNWQGQQEWCYLLTSVYYTNLNQASCSFHIFFHFFLSFKFSFYSAFIYMYLNIQWTSIVLISLLQKKKKTAMLLSQYPQQNNQEQPLTC